MKKDLAYKINKLGIGIFLGTTIIFGSRAIYKAAPKTIEGVTATLTNTCSLPSDEKPYDPIDEMPIALPLIFSGAVLARYGARKYQELDSNT